MNARAQYSFLHKTLAAFVQLDNVFNRQYSDLLGNSYAGQMVLREVYSSGGKKG